MVNFFRSNIVMQSANYVIGSCIAVIIMLGTAFWLYKKHISHCCNQKGMPNVQLIEKIFNTKAEVLIDENVVKISIPLSFLSAVRHCQSNCWWWSGNQRRFNFVNHAIISIKRCLPLCYRNNRSLAHSHCFLAKKQTS